MFSLILNLFKLNKLTYQLPINGIGSQIYINICFSIGNLKFRKISYKN